MRYKVTSKADIIILANMPTKDDGEGKVTKPSETLMWVPVFANKPTDGLGTILGVDPRCVHESKVVTEGHFTYVPIGVGKDCCKEHFGLFKIEPSSVPD
ncbi:MAG TPA: hypothetical protein VMJ12_06915 [Candidatus Acidoferrales bacterium]|nr:hypothetical protein [Candidatus Acidoferrales bacterium]